MRTIRLSFPWRRVVALFFACLVCTALWAEAAQSQLADKVIRLHVLANSDSQADQALKRYVRDQVLAQTTPLLEGVTSAPEAEAILQANLGLLTQTAQVAIAAQGYDYSVSVRLEETWFPTRQYQDVALPAGNYQALRVLIGEAEGHNWWCVLYPNLCFMDSVHAIVPKEGKEELRSVLTDEEYAMIVKGTPVKIKWFFLQLTE